MRVRPKRDNQTPQQRSDTRSARTLTPTPLPAGEGLIWVRTYGKLPAVLGRIGPIQAPRTRLCGCRTCPSPSTTNRSTVSDSAPIGP